MSEDPIDTEALARVALQAAFHEVAEWVRPFVGDGWHVDVDDRVDELALILDILERKHADGQLICKTSEWPDVYLFSVELYTLAIIGSDLWDEPFRPIDAILAAVLARKLEGHGHLTCRQWIDRQWIVAHAHAKILYLDSAVSLRVDNVIGSDFSVAHIICVQGLESFRHLVQGVLAEVLRVGLDVIDGDVSRDKVL